IGLRLHDLRTVDFKQRIAALDVVADLGKQAGHASGERRLHDRAGIVIERNLADCQLVLAERIDVDIDDVQLMHLVGGDLNHVGVFRRRLRRCNGRGAGPAAAKQGSEHERNANSSRAACGRRRAHALLRRQFDHRSTDDDRERDAKAVTSICPWAFHLDASRLDCLAERAKLVSWTYAAAVPPGPRLTERSSAPTSRSITACSTIIMARSLSPFYCIGEYILRIRVTALRLPPRPADRVSNSKDSKAYGDGWSPRGPPSAVIRQSARLHRHDFADPAPGSAAGPGQSAPFSRSASAAGCPVAP